MLACYSATVLLTRARPWPAPCSPQASAPSPKPHPQASPPSLSPEPQPQASPPSLTPKPEPHPKPEQVLLSLARAGHVEAALRLLDAASGRGVHLAPSVREERELWLHCFEHGVQDDAPQQSIRVAAGGGLAVA